MLPAPGRVGKKRRTDLHHLTSYTFETQLNKGKEIFAEKTAVPVLDQSRNRVKGKKKKKKKRGGKNECKNVGRVPNTKGTERKRGKRDKTCVRK